MRKKVNLSSKIWKNEIRLIAVRKQNGQLVQTSYINELNCSCFCHITNILLTDLSRSVWVNLELGRYRPHCVRSVLTTSVKILRCRPPARLIRAKYRRRVRALFCCRKGKSKKEVLRETRDVVVYWSPYFLSALPLPKCFTTEQSAMTKNSFISLHFQVIFSKPYFIFQMKKKKWHQPWSVLS